jgi:transposase
MRRYDVSNEAWKRIEPILPPQVTGKRGRPPKDNRVMLNGMIWIDRTGAQWRELPECYGPWQGVYARFRKWKEEGVLERVFKALSADFDPENLSLDSTCKVQTAVKRGRKQGCRPYTRWIEHQNSCCG